MFQNILTCRTCRKEDSIENEDHILQCDALKSEVENPGEVDFNFVYMDLNHQKKAVKAYKAVRKREVLLKYQNDKWKIQPINVDGPVAPDYSVWHAAP